MNQETTTAPQVQDGPVEGLFRGAHRAVSYAERPQPAEGRQLEVVRATDAAVFTDPSRTVERSSSGLRALFERLGLVRPAVTDDQIAAENAERIIRQATWTRSMNIAVINRKGGSGKTPATLIIAGILAHVRGGYVAAWEGAEAPGDLVDRAEGTPARGLTELLAGAGLVKSAGNLAGYTAPQTSHAAVVGTVTPRNELRPEDVTTVRRLLDAYYHLTVTDTANNHLSPTFQRVRDTADAVLIPATTNLQSLRGLSDAFTSLDAATGAHAAGLRARTVVALTHDGGPEDAELAATAVETIQRNFGPRAVIEVPFDPAIRRDGEISLAALSPESLKAWREVTRHLVEALLDAPATSPIPEN